MRYVTTTRRAIDPFAGFRSFDALFDHLTPRAADTAFAPAVEIREDAEAWHLVAELPGVAPEQVKLTVEQRVLTLAGEKAAPEAAAARSERRFGRFRRSFVLPEGVDTDRISATSVHGVLTIAIPKVATPAPREITVQVQAN